MITYEESIKKSKELSADLDEIVLAFVKSNADMSREDLLKTVLITLSLHLGEMLRKANSSNELFDMLSSLIKGVMNSKCDCPECSNE